MSMGVVGVNSISFSCFFFRIICLATINQNMNKPVPTGKFSLEITEDRANMSVEVPFQIEAGLNEEVRLTNKHGIPHEDSTANRGKICWYASSLTL